MDGRNDIREDNLRNDVLRGVGFLPIPETCWRCFDTADCEGFVVVDGNNLPSGPLDLYLDSTGWYLNIYSFGGYELTDASLFIKQCKAGTQYDIVAELPIDWGLSTVSTVVVDEALANDLGISSAYIGLTIDMTHVDLTDMDIYLDSNYLPSYTNCYLWDTDCSPIDRTLGKWVKFIFHTDWTGCGQPDQDFQVLLAYNNMRQESQTPD
jgi:hypothetical protein